MIVDMGHFERVNDERGHLAGDQALRATAALLSGTSRTVDVLARWGGEECAIVLPATGLTDAHTAAQRIRAALEAQPLVIGGAEPPRSTASIGVAELRPDEDARALLACVDQALYRAKEGGRNRVEAA